MREDKLENNLITSLVRASQANVNQKGSTTGSYQDGLIEEEVYSNLFVFNFAGHDAAANSLAIGICLLVTRPISKTGSQRKSMLFSLASNPRSHSIRLRFHVSRAA